MIQSHAMCMGKKWGTMHLTQPAPKWDKSGPSLGDRFVPCFILELHAAGCHQQCGCSHTKTSGINAGQQVPGQGQSRGDLCPGSFVRSLPGIPQRTL